MRTRGHHQRSLLLDRDVVQVGLVSFAACVGTAGLLYAYYWSKVWRTARKAACMPAHSECLLVFGKHAPNGLTDVDFSLRLDRAAAVLRAGPDRDVLLLGGGPVGVPTEAEVAQRGLMDRGFAATRFHLEAASRDTLQNLRNARDLMRARGITTPVTLVSSRYHLARCLLFARQLGFQAEACAAEPEFRVNLRNLWSVTGEAGFFCISDVGTRWARLIGARRMLARVT